MRVTDKMIFDSASLRSGQARDRLQTAIDQTSSGLKVEHPWDDPTATASVVTHRLSLKRLETIQVVAGRAADELQSADDALGGVVDAMARARELTIQMSNETYNATDRLNSSAEVRQLFGHVLGLVNTRVANRYVFGGNLDDAPPFDATGTYLGDAGIRKIEVFPGVMQDASINADQVIKGAGGGTDVFAVLDGLATALENNDLAAVRAAIEPLDDALTQISTGRSTVGAAMNAIDVAALAARSTADIETTTLSNLTEVDVIESTSRLALAQRALDAALTASARSFDLSLLNKLG